MFLTVILVGMVVMVTSEYFLHKQNKVTEAMVGDKVTLPCRLEDKSGPLQWTRDGFGLGTRRNLPGFPRLYMGGKDMTRDWDLVIEDVEVGDQAVYECQVGHLRSRTRLVVNIPSTDSVIYGPHIVLQPQSVHARQGETVHMSCLAKSHPPPSYTWYKVGDTKVYSFASTLITTATNTSEGSYYCLARTNSSTSATSNLAKLLIIRRPVIISKQTQYGSLNTTARVSCVSNYTEEETRTSWRFKEEEIVKATEEEKYAVRNNVKDNVIENILTIYNATQEDFGVYTCSMENSLGSDEKDILLINKDLVGDLHVLHLVLSILGCLSCIAVVLVAFKCFHNFRKYRPGQLGNGRSVNCLLIHSLTQIIFLLIVYALEKFSEFLAQQLFNTFFWGLNTPSSCSTYHPDFKPHPQMFLTFSNHFLNVF